MNSSCDQVAATVELPVCEASRERVALEGGEVHLNITENCFEVADRRFEDPNPLIQPVKDPLLDRLADDHVQDMNDLPLLPVAVQPADPLLDSHRVPWQVVVEHPGAELKVETFGPDLARQ